MSNLKCVDSIRKKGSYLITYNLVYIKSTPEDPEILFTDQRVFIEGFEFDPETPAKTAEA